MKVLIPTSGIGSRLGELTKYTNKALVRIGKKPALSHIIESYPENTDFVIMIGHYGQHIRDFISLAYPKLNVEYVVNEHTHGLGASLGRSMLEARDILGCPFIFHACDTLVNGPIPKPDNNWIGVYGGSDTTHYASWKVCDGKLCFSEKGATQADFLHIGLVGINDYKLFWDMLEGLYRSNPDNTTLNDCQTIEKMIEKGSEMELVEFKTWYDVGNAEALRRARQEFGSSLDDLDKVEESLFIFDKFVIKFFADGEIVKNRAKRGKILEGFVPKMEGVVGNFYRYEFVPGDLYSHTVQPNALDFKQFLEWVENSFWREEKEVDDAEFKKVCRSFYFNKTQKRIDQFLKSNNLVDSEHIINGERVPTVKELLDRVDFDRLSDGLQSRFHGDFILDNILKTKDGFSLIDWRQDFGGLLRGGDRYYDLAKMNHNLTVNHSVINRNLFTIESNGNNVRVEIMRPSNLVECQNIFFEFFRKYKYDIRKVRFLTAIIWLNMSPLHHYPFNHFLYYFGKLNLWRALKENDIARKI